MFSSIYLILIMSNLQIVTTELTNLAHTCNAKTFFIKKLM